MSFLYLECLSLHIFILSRVLKSYIQTHTYIHTIISLNADTAAVDGGCRGVRLLWKSLVLLELSGWLDKKGVRSKGAGVAIPGSRKMHGQGWAVISSGVLTGADNLLFKTVDEAKMGVQKPIQTL